MVCFYEEILDFRFKYRIKNHNFTGSNLIQLSF